MSNPFETKIAPGSAVETGQGARALKVISSLSRKMAQPGGLTVADIERRSNERLLCHKAGVMEAIEKAIGQLEELSMASPQDGDKIHRTTSTMLDVAGFFDTGPLYEAGYGLCETCDAMKARNVWLDEAVRVHVNALRLIARDRFEHTAVSAKLLAGLKTVQKHARGE